MIVVKVATRQKVMHLTIFMSWVIWAYLGYQIYAGDSDPRWGMPIFILGFVPYVLCNAVFITPEEDEREDQA